MIPSGHCRALRDYGTGAASVAAEPLKSSYTYDAGGNITQLTTPGDGTWNLSYDGPGRLTKAEPAPTVRATTPCYASDFMLGKRAGCWVDPVYMDNEPEEQGNTKISPKWTKTPGNWSVVGVPWDHCTNPYIPKIAKENPAGISFAAACDSHDYGCGIIYSHKFSNFLKPKKYAVDAVFYNIMKNGTCNYYKNYPTTNYGQCVGWAWIYYQAVYYQGGIEMNPEG
ncbi:phospholipase A2 [Nonomuraea sp. B5E05]|uniref:phospholipase A2 n=1 Tax=Nonomuraea sp. B5E05 TaxID=3153569 RepID=UPI00326004CD